MEHGGAATDLGWGDVHLPRQVQEVLVLQAGSGSWGGGRTSQHGQKNSYTPKMSTSKFS